MNHEDRNGIALFGILAAFAVMVVLVLPMWAIPKYNVWRRTLQGRGELAQAEYNRQIATLEAKARLESSKMLADAEVVRAEGVAKANKIIGNSLNENESYLWYLWIQNLDSANLQVVYVPTEANLPILEAGRRPPVHAR